MGAAAFRVLIADDDPIVCQVLRKIIARQSGMDVAGQAGDGEQTLSLIEELRPDALVLDLLMPKMHGLEIMHAIRMSYVRVAIIVLAASITKQEALEAFQLGARGVLPKRYVNMLPACLQCIQQGGYWAGAQSFTSAQEACLRMSEQVGSTSAGNKWNFTRRELQIISLVGSGKTNREIAEVLSIREPTVKRHLANIFEKCGVANRVELTKFASIHGLLRGGFRVDSAA